MDVRCERCRAQYVFDDEQITPSGLTVQCTNCGHVFRVKKKELVVTVAVKPGELEGTPFLATSVAPRPPRPVGADAERAREWRLRQASGEVLTFRELATLQKWIVEGRVARDDELSATGEGFRRLGSIAELAPFFQVVEAAERGRLKGTTEPAMPSARVGAGAGLPPPPSGFPPPSFAQPRSALPARPPPSLPTLALPAAPPVDAPAAPVAAGPEAPPAKQPAPPRRRAALPVLVVLLLVVAAGAGIYVFAPGLLAPAPPRSAAPAELEVRGQARARPQAGESSTPTPGKADANPTPTPTPTPTPDPTATGTATPTAATPTASATPPATEPSPAPTNEPPAAPAAPRAPKGVLAEADRLRVRGDCARALELYGRIVARNPEHVRALTGRALCYLDQEEYGPAEASFQAALAVEPTAPEALLGLAETYRWQGRPAEAITYYEKYLSEHPDGEDAPVARNAVETLRR